MRRAAMGGAVVAGGAAIGARGGDGAPLAAPSADTDAKIFNFFLMLEHVQEAFYRQAVESGRLEGRLPSSRAVGRRRASTPPS